MQNQLFKFGNHEVRVVVAENNEPFFVAKDICEVLGYAKSSSDVIKTHCKVAGCTKTVLQVSNKDGVIQGRETILINEGNLYRLILKSKKKEAEKFETWVCDEVLPAIRKHGMYANGQTIEKMLDNPDVLIQTLQKLKQEKEEKQRIEAQKEQLEQINKSQFKELKEAAPKVEYYDDVLQSNSTYTTNQIAKELGMSAIELNRRLYDLKVQYKQSDTWLLYAKYQKSGYTKTKTHQYTDTKGMVQTSMNTVWTEKGRHFIHTIIDVGGAKYKLHKQLENLDNQTA